MLCCYKTCLISPCFQILVRISKNLGDSETQDFHETLTFIFKVSVRET